MGLHKLIKSNSVYRKSLQGMSIPELARLNKCAENTIRYHLRKHEDEILEDREYFNLEELARKNRHTIGQIREILRRARERRSANG